MNKLRFKRFSNAVLFCCICFAFFSCKPKTKPVPAKEKPKTAVSAKPAALTNCAYDNDVSSLGIGLVMAPEKFVLFNDSLLTDTFAKVDMYGADMNNSPVCSKFFKPDYGIMHFVCLGKTKTAYKVLNGQADVKYLPKTKAYAFMSWNDYISQSFGVRRIINNKGKRANHLPLRKRPGSADTIAIPKGLEMFCPIKIQDDWLQVKYDCFYNDENSKHEGEPCSNYISKCKDPVTGWIKWREGNKLLIDVLIME
jgi:hypothetical protein